MEASELTELVNRARNKDNQAIAELIQATQNKLLFVAKSYVKNDADAADVLQNSYIKAFSTLDTLEDSRKFEGWMNRIVTNTALDHMKKASTRYDMKFTDLGDEDDDLSFDPADEKIESQPELSFSQKETERIIREIIDSLSDEQRVAVMMYFYDDMTTREIAEELGCKETTVKARIRYAKEKIKDSVVKIQKRDGIKLYNLAPLSFFLYLLKGYAGGNAGAAASAAGAASAAAHSQAGTVSAVTKAGTGAAVKSAAAKSVIGTVIKITIVGAVAAGGAVTYKVIADNRQKSLESTVTALPESTPTATVLSVEKGDYRGRNYDDNIDLQDNNIFKWDVTDDGETVTQKGTYLIEDGQLILTVKKDQGTGDEISSCKFNVDDTVLTVDSGDSDACISEKQYKFQRGATPLKYTTDDVRDLLLENGYTITDCVTSKEENNYLHEKDTYKIEKKDDPGAIFICNGSAKGTAAGFAYLPKTKKGFPVLERNKSFGIIRSTFSDNFTLPTYTYIEPAEAMSIGYFDVNGGLETYDSTKMPLDDAKKLAEDTNDDLIAFLWDLNITEEEFLNFAVTYAE